MNVLFLTQVLPYPPESGPKVKTWNVLKYLAARHRVTLVSFVRGEQSQEVRQLEQYCHAVHTVLMDRTLVRDLWALLVSFMSGKPFIIVRDDRAMMRRLIDGLVRRQHFDIVHVDQLNMAQFARNIPGARKLLDTHNALWLLYKRLGQVMNPGPTKWLLGREWRLLKRYEGQVCRTIDAAVAVSEQDKKALQEAIGSARDISVVPIAIDTREVRPIARHPNGNRILYIGTMYWPPNVNGVMWFLRHVWPLICREDPQVEFDVVGPNPPKRVLKFCRRDKRVNVTGYVEDLTPYLERAAAIVVPLRAGSGMRVKILNALAQELPVVSTSVGWEGIAVEAGRHLLIAITPEEFAQATLRLMRDQKLATAMGRNGRRLIESTYDYQVTCRALDDVYERLMTESASVQ